MRITDAAQLLTRSVPQALSAVAGLTRPHSPAAVPAPAAPAAADSVSLSREAQADRAQSGAPRPPRPMILVQGLGSSPETFRNGAIERLTRTGGYVYGGTIVEVRPDNTLVLDPPNAPAGANLYTINLRGNNNTIGQNGETVARAITAITETQDAANPGTHSQVDVVGWSHGGLDGLRAAELTGDRVAHLMTLGTPFGGSLAAGVYPYLEAASRGSTAGLRAANPANEMIPGSDELQELLAQRNRARGLQMLNVTGTISLIGDGVVGAADSRLSGADRLEASNYSHVDMHNSPEIMDQLVNYANDRPVAQRVERPSIAEAMSTVDRWGSQAARMTDTLYAQARQQVTDWGLA